MNSENLNPIDIYCMAPQDRSDRVRWLLEELQVPYKDHFLSKKKGELLSANYLKLNPMGRVPTIVDNGQVLFESVGICLYLADKYQHHQKLAPAINSAERGLYNQWMVYSVGSLECVVAKMFTLNGKTDSEQKAITDYVEAQCQILKKPLVSVLTNQDYILKSGFSAADIMLSCVIPGAWDYLVKGEPALEAYMERLMSRPAAKKTKVFEVPIME